MQGIEKLIFSRFQRPCARMIEHLPALGPNQHPEHVQRGVARTRDAVADLAHRPGSDVQLPRHLRLGPSGSLYQINEFFNFRVHKKFLN